MSAFRGGRIAEKHPPALLAGHPFSSDGREKAASASGELANNFPANADLEERAVHGPGEWFKAAPAVKARGKRAFLVSCTRPPLTRRQPLS
jgi:hypothetical protein